MNLPVFLQKLSPLKKEEIEHYLALEIKNREVKAAVWQKVKEKIALVGTGNASCSGQWDDALKAADEAIMQASGDVPQEKIGKVILGIPQDWTSDTKIINKHLDNLKKLCTQLSLKPLGFIVIPEAIVNYLRQLEGVPPTALIIGPEEKSFTLTLVKAGKIEEIKVIKKKDGETMPRQIEDGLSDFSVEALPSRILLYDGSSQLEDLKQDLLSHRWADKLPFLHLPKIELLDRNFDIKALAMSSGMQMGGVVITQDEPVSDEDLDIEEDKEDEEETMGFVKDKDIMEDKEPETHSGQEPVEEAEENEELEDVALSESIEEGWEPKQPEMPVRTALPALKISAPRLPKVNLSFLQGTIKPLVFLILILIITGAVFGAAWWYLPKAEVKIWVQTKPLEKGAEVTLVQNAQTDKERSGKIASRLVETEETASKKTSTTGKKTVGDPAKGKIVIYNRTENEKKFPKGIVLAGPGDLKFTLNEEVTVASTTAFSTSFSSSTATITASKIGTEGNLPSGANFSFKDYPTSSYFARTDEGLSGGTSKEVAAVSKTDQDKLLEGLTGELSGKAKEDIKGKLSADEKIVEETLELSVKEKKFDKDIGDEASELNLSLSVNFKALAYNEKEIKDSFLKSLEEATPGGYELNKEGTKIEVLGVSKKDKEMILKMTAKATLLPKLNIDEIRRNIAGKKPSVAQEYLKNLGSVDRVEILIKFPVLKNLQTLPHLPQNIQIETIST